MGDHPGRLLQLRELQALGHQDPMGTEGDGTKVFFVQLFARQPTAKVVQSGMGTGLRGGPSREGHQKRELDPPMVLLVGWDKEQDSHRWSRGIFNRVVDFIHPTVGEFIHPKSLDSHSGYISPPIIPRIKRRSTKSSTHLGSRYKKSTF